MPASFRARRRNARSRYVRTRNRSARSGRPEGAAARSPRDKIGSGLAAPSGAAWRSRGLFQAIAQIGLQFGERSAVRARTRPHEQVAWRASLPLLGQPAGSKELAQAALKTIAFHDGVSVPRNDDSDAGRAPRVHGPQVDIEGTTAPASPGAEHRTDLARASQASGPGERTPAGHGAIRRTRFSRGACDGPRRSP